MSYKSFKNISYVCEKFNIDYESKNFIQEKKIILNQYFLEKLNELLNDEGSFSSEAAISERILFPMIYEVAREYNLPVWSQLQFNVDKKLGLTGNPDYIIAPALRGKKGFKLPVVCLGEAKKKDFDEGWGQVGAEMYAAQIANKNNEIPIYGLVSDGQDWEFGKLENNKFTINKSKIVAPDNLQKVFDTLNWLFGKANSNLKVLLKKNYKN